jgi:hypothetical protein|tara:strand:- start:44619 stop:44723 length:105 start_codon:yes stop_codon:yes gene_type:complete
MNKQIVGAVDSQMKQSDELDKAIRKNLEALGYGE